MWIRKSRWLWAFHNLVAHPLMVILPERYGTNIHDTTALWAETAEVLESYKKPLTKG